MFLVVFLLQALESVLFTSKAEAWEQQAADLTQQSILLERQAAALAGPSDFARSTKLRRRAVAVAKAAENLESNKGALLGKRSHRALL
ncbi:hypothetical protein WJX73_008375 [Symbiochloris irregularis]|uniref:Uncharacterized protein n=1 Tax=Symbiochloris irregularis TaxID=706552 RepID=A0AAW1P2A3_9CHLO